MAQRDRYRDKADVDQDLQALAGNLLHLGARLLAGVRFDGKSLADRSGAKSHVVATFGVKSHAGHRFGVKLHSEHICLAGQCPNVL